MCVFIHKGSCHEVALSILGPVKPGPMVTYRKQCRILYTDTSISLPISLVEETDKVWKDVPWSKFEGISKGV
jgi:hypothetical protein